MAIRGLQGPSIYGRGARALSRLTKAGAIERLSKGTYYRPRPTTLGTSRPNPAAIRRLAAKRKNIFPAGIAAANLLGFTTQNPKSAELATNARSLPRKLIGSDTIIHTRRPEAWANLSEMDAALLDFLRQRGSSSELSSRQTIRRTLRLLSDDGALSAVQSRIFRTTAYSRSVGVWGSNSERMRNRFLICAIF